MDNSSNRDGQHDERTLQVCSGAAILTTALVDLLEGESLSRIGLHILYWIFIYAVLILVVGRFVK